jgi:N-acetylmuramoyl-L-alanine amidase
MPASLTRRQAVAGSALLALTRFLPLPSAAAARSASSADAVDVGFAIPPSSFRRPRGGRGPLTTRSLRAPRRLDVLGFRWSAPHDVRLELRTRRRGRWSKWVTLPAASGHGPDRAPRPRATEAAAVGGARVFQLRATGAVQDLHAHGVAVARPAAIAAAAPPRRPRAAGDVAAAIISRREWRAQAPRSTPDFGEIQLAFVHHTVSTNGYGPEDSAAIVRAIQQYHRNTLGWDDIGYQFLVDAYGRIFEGREGGIDQAVVGAQAQGYNHLSTGISVIGTHTSEPISSAAFETLAAVLGWKLSLHGVPTQGTVTVTSAGGPLNRYPAGRAVRLQRISGHRDGDATACPGNTLYAQLPALRARAAEHAAPTGLSLSMTPARARLLETATASGRLLLPDGSPGAGVEVEVQEKTAGGWKGVVPAVTDAFGAWSASLALPTTRSLRAVARPDPAQPALMSPPVRFEVRFAVSAVLEQSRISFGQSTVLRGTVEPRRRSRPLIVTVDRRAAGGRYVRVARFRGRARNGRFRIPLTPSGPGLYRVRVSAPGDRLNAPGRSAPVFVRVLG